MKSMQVNNTTYEDEFQSLMGEEVAVFTTTYIYYGTLQSVGGLFITLENPYIVYETGSFSDNKFKDSQPLNVTPSDIVAAGGVAVGKGKASQQKVARINIGHIESIFASGQKVA